MIPKHIFNIRILLLLCLLLPACSDSADVPEDRSDTSVTDAGIDSRATTQSATDNAMKDPAPETTTIGRTSDAGILAKLKAMNEMEVAHGTIAREKGRNAEVKAIGKMLVDDHTKMRIAGENLAGTLEITPEPAPGDSTRQIMDRTVALLQNTIPQVFDSTFIALTIEVHQRALEDLRTMQAQAQHQELRDLITRAVPIIEEHLNRARQIRGSLGGTPATGATSSRTARPPPLHAIASR